ncbi:hypothetical protein EV363DRAFT_1194704 [Boletus edulis]|nr:hypothetical protein EV363DRAFT_1194704 [Boletus edulis]
MSGTWGWVHRNISAGNVLRCGHQGKIADLEYARALNLSGESHDVRTGTPDFMACEVEGQRYLFLSDPSMLPEGDGAPIVPVPPPFRFNPLHDLESWWWIPTWVLHYHVDSDTQTLPPQHDTIYQCYFPGLNLAPGTTRTGVLQSALTTSIMPKSFESTAGWINLMRVKLVECYRAAEQSSSVDYKKPTSVSTQFMLTSIQRARK